MGNGVADQAGADDGNFHALLLVLRCRYRGRTAPGEAGTAPAGKPCTEFKEKQKRILRTECCGSTMSFVVLTSRPDVLTKRY
jgi:hypothetical protein